LASDVAHDTCGGPIPGTGKIDNSDDRFLFLLLLFIPDLDIVVVVVFLVAFAIKV
jgi:hypothetical protein